MAKEGDEGNILLPHHEQQPLCMTRLPYRQGRKLTAVKVYTINNESAHLLIFNVPSLNLRQETKSFFLKYGKILQFNLTKGYKTEKFTEVYHILYENIHSARIAKKMTDGKGFYGEVLHVCYAPEFESLKELKRKLFQRKFDVLKRLNTIDKQRNIESNQHRSDTESKSEIEVVENEFIVNEIDHNVSYEIVKDPVEYTEKRKLYMGNENTIYTGKKKKRREKETNKKVFEKDIDNIEVIDCYNTEKEVVTNINEGLNFKNFGNEIVRKIITKPVNKIIFNKN